MITCKFCHKQIDRTSIWCRFCQRIVKEELSKLCPSCTESIIKWCRVCRFCNAPVPVGQKNDGNDDVGGVYAKLSPHPPEGPSYAAYLIPKTVENK
jgi:hypothetical protein